jgi:hypothetical protein
MQLVTGRTIVGSALLCNTDIVRGLLANVFSDVERIPPVSLRTSRIKDNASMVNLGLLEKRGLSVKYFYDIMCFLSEQKYTQMYYDQLF